MGIKHFATWFNKNFEKCLYKFSRHNYPEMNIDTFLIDMNGIFHNSAQRVFKYGRYAPEQSLLRARRNVNKVLVNDITIREYHNDVFNTINELVKITSPKQTLYLAIDGVAPRAKQNQQRQRRYKTTIELNDENTTTNTFNPVLISTGTKFMYDLSQFIHSSIQSKLQSGEWNFQVIFNDERCKGEGEHKLIEYIRGRPSEETFCVNALDADLFMLALGTMKPNFYLLREEMYSTDYDFTYININQARTDLMEIMGKNGIHDFILICFLCGNDFLPNIPSITINDGALTSMLEIYKSLNLSLTSIDDDGEYTINIPNFKKFLSLINEEDMIKYKINNSRSYIFDPILPTSVDTFVFDDYLDVYNKKYFTDDMMCDKACNNYIEGCHWVLRYYLYGVRDWDWYYDFSYAPYIKTMLKHIDDKTAYIVFESDPYTPLIQLLCILPPSSFQYALPKPLSLFCQKYPEFYPNEKSVKINYDGKRQKWEGVVELKNIDIHRINEYAQPYIKKLREKDLIVNKLGKVVKYYCDTENSEGNFVVDIDGSITLGKTVKVEYQ